MWWVLFRNTHLDVNVEKSAFYHLESEAHLHPRTDSVEEAFLGVRINANKVAANGGESTNEAHK